LSVDWSGLAQVAWVSLLFGAGVVVVFSIGLIGLSRFQVARSSAPSPGASQGSPVVADLEMELETRWEATTARTADLVWAGLCFTVCAAAVVYGLYLIIPQFHN
jgi:hypothetical protein